MFNRRAALTALLSVSAAPSLLAQEAPWPSRPITLVLPFPAGGQTDAVARNLARALEASLGQPVVVDNRPGANSLIGTNFVARAAPDGYTLLLNMTALVTNPILLPNVTYDAFKDFAPIYRLYEIPAVWAVPPGKAQTLDQFIKQAQASKLPLNFATTGHASSSHYFGEIFARGAGIQLNHVPYKGETPLLPDLVSGRIDAAVVSSASAVQFGKDGRIRPLAVSGKNRWKALPDQPTFVELGIPGMTTETYCGIFAPTRTPQPVIDKLNAAISRIASTTEFQNQMIATGLEVAPPLTPTQFAALMRKSHEEWTAIKKESAIKLDA